MPVMTSPLALAIEPILGKQIKLRAGDTWWCPKCRSVMVTITKAPPPHAARLDCSDCGRFRKWMGFNEAKAFIETTAIFGWPTTAAIQPLSQNSRIWPRHRATTRTFRQRRPIPRTSTRNYP
jgi:hypothetical protein